MTRSRPSVALLAVTAAVLLAGCGGSGGPRMARQDAAPLITLADRIPREGPCAQARDIRALRTRATALVNAHRIPPALQEPLTSGVNAFVEPVCLPVIPTVTIPAPRKHGHGHGDGNDGGGNNGGGGGD